MNVIKYLVERFFPRKIWTKIYEIKLLEDGVVCGHKIVLRDQFGNIKIKRT